MQKSIILSTGVLAIFFQWELEIICPEN